MHSSRMSPTTSTRTTRSQLPLSLARSCASLLLLVVFARAACVLPGGTTTIATSGDAASFSALGCTEIVGNVDVTCVGSSISSLSFLSGVKSIQGYLRIRDCSGLANVDALSSLNTISGTNTMGLVIWNNALLTNLLGLQNLQTIGAGGVSIFLNPRLCYVDLFRFDRVIVGATSPSTYLLSYSINQTCISVNCDASCTCGWCAGPGVCKITCPAEDITWIAAPIVLGVVLLVLIIVFVWYLQKTGRLSCQVYASLYHPLGTKPPPSPLMPAKTLNRAGSKNRVGPASSADPAAAGAAGAGVAGSSSGNAGTNETGGDTATAGVTNPLAGSPTANTTNTSPFAAPRQLGIVRPPGSPRTNRVAPLAGTPANNRSGFGGSMLPSIPSMDADDGDMIQRQPEESRVDSHCICGRVAEFDCSRCGTQSYCSSECQRNDWKNHRDQCRRSKAILRRPSEVQLGGCVVCNKAGQFECSRCSGPVYCSAVCQRSHWRAHSVECKRKSVGDGPSPSPLPPGAAAPSEGPAPVAVTVVEEVARPQPVYASVEPQADVHHAPAPAPAPEAASAADAHAQAAPHASRPTSSKKPNLLSVPEDPQAEGAAAGGEEETQA